LLDAARREKKGKRRKTPVSEDRTKKKEEFTERMPLSYIDSNVAASGEGGKGRNEVSRFVSGKGESRRRSHADRRNGVDEEKPSFRGKKRKEESPGEGKKVSRLS